MPFLLERLATPVRTSDGRVEAFDEVAAVAAQVQRIVATRTVLQGASEAVVPWGLPNVADLGHNSQTALEKFAEQARRLIAQHEPRLAQLRVSVEAQDNLLAPYRLLVSGVLSKMPYEFSVSLAS